MLKLIAELKATAASIGSIVQAQLMKEDAARLERIKELAETSGSYDAFEKEALYCSWTQGDFRTPELHGSLVPFLTAAYSSVHDSGDDIDAEVRTRWVEFNRDRASKLVGCL